MHYPTAISPRVQVMEYGFPRYGDFIEELSANANKEVAIETALQVSGRTCLRLMMLTPSVHLHLLAR